MSDTAPIVYLVDDDRDFLDSLRWLLEPAGYNIDAHLSAESFLAACNPQQAGCLVLDVRMPGMSGLVLQDELARRGIRIPIIFLTGHGEVAMAVTVIKKGAFEFVEKPFNDEEFIAVIERAIRHDAEMRRTQARRLSAAARIAALSPREREVFERAVAGKPNKTIAGDLGISVKTVEAHRARMMMKMGAASIAELVQLALDGAPPQNF